MFNLNNNNNNTLLVGIISLYLHISSKVFPFSKSTKVNISLAHSGSSVLLAIPISILFVL